jgi:hypothetical protein
MDPSGCRNVCDPTTYRTFCTADPPKLTLPYTHSKDVLMLVPHTSIMALCRTSLNLIRLDTLQYRYPRSDPFKRPILVALTQVESLSRRYQHQSVTFLDVLVCRLMSGSTWGGVSVSMPGLSGSVQKSRHDGSSVPVVEAGDRPDRRKWLPIKLHAGTSPLLDYWKAGGLELKVTIATDDGSVEHYFESGSVYPFELQNEQWSACETGITNALKITDLKISTQGKQRGGNRPKCQVWVRGMLDGVFVFDAYSTCFLVLGRLTKETAESDAAVAAAATAATGARVLRPGRVKDRHVQNAKHIKDVPVLPAAHHGGVLSWNQDESEADTSTPISFAGTACLLRGTSFDSTVTDSNTSTPPEALIMGRPCQRADNTLVKRAQRACTRYSNATTNAKQASVYSALSCILDDKLYNSLSCSDTTCAALETLIYWLTRDVNCGHPSDSLASDSSSSDDEDRGHRPASKRRRDGTYRNIETHSTTGSSFTIVAASGSGSSVDSRTIRSSDASVHGSDGGSTASIDEEYDTDSQDDDGTSPVAVITSKLQGRVALNDNAPVAMVVVELQHEPALDSLIRLEGEALDTLVMMPTICWPTKADAVDGPLDSAIAGGPQCGGVQSRLLTDIPSTISASKDEILEEPPYRYDAPLLCVCVHVCARVLRQYVAVDPCKQRWENWTSQGIWRCS